MAVATVTQIASAPNQLPEGSGVSDLYVRSINTHWLQSTHRRVIAVTLVHRSESDWSQLGRYLTSELLTVGEYVGLSLDGTTIDVKVVLDWLQSLATSHERSFVDLKLSVGSGLSPWNLATCNLTWNSFHSAVGQKWIARLWEQLPSRLFNQGADLMIASFIDDQTASLGWGSHLSLETFGDSLMAAVGWMIPLDDNIGFIVGLEGESTIGQAIAKLHHPNFKFG